MDLINPNTKYKILTDINVSNVSSAVGCLVQKSLIICGGRYFNDDFHDCSVIGKSKMKMEMLEKRRSAAGVLLNYDTLWIVGGLDCDDIGLRTTEFIKLGKHSVKGPDLPFSVYGHSMIKYDEKNIYLIGGSQNDSVSKKTWIVNPANNFQIKDKLQHKIIQRKINYLKYNTFQN